MANGSPDPFDSTGDSLNTSAGSVADAPGVSIAALPATRRLLSSHIAALLWVQGFIVQFLKWYSESAVDL